MIAAQNTPFFPTVPFLGPRPRVRGVESAPCKRVQGPCKVGSLCSAVTTLANPARGVLAVPAHFSISAQGGSLR